MGLGILGQKIAAIVAGGALVSLAAVGAFASQDFQTTEEETPTAEATETATAEATETPEPDPTDTPEPDATETPEPTPTSEPIEDGDEEREIGGIPEDHPVFTPDDDEECEKHESRVKTTPSGKQVRVPCHATGGDGEHPGVANGKKGGNGEEEGDEEEVEEGEDE